MITIHCQPKIGWQGPFAQKLAQGLDRLKLKYAFTQERSRVDNGLAILLGTTLWRNVEATGNYLLVDRCSFGDTDRNVSLVFNGHGRRGKHKVPKGFGGSRWDKHGVELMPWKTGTKRVVCGQTESYCRRDLNDFYMTSRATHFRPHPTQEHTVYNLPIWRLFDDVGSLVTLNSSVAVQGFINGVQTEVHDAGGMAYGYDCNDEDRLRLMHWLAWTQWTHDEISQGTPIAHLFEDC